MRSVVHCKSYLATNLLADLAPWKSGFLGSRIWAVCADMILAIVGHVEMKIVFW